MEDDKKEARKRLLLDITEDQHREIKMRAVKRNITIKKWVMRAIAEAIAKEKKYE